MKYINELTVDAGSSGDAWQEEKLDFLRGKLNVSGAEIESAVSRVGGNPEKVEEYLLKSKTRVV